MRNIFEKFDPNSKKRPDFSSPVTQAKTSFWELRSNKIYLTLYEKFIDFIFGIILSICFLLFFTYFDHTFAFFTIKANNPNIFLDNLVFMVLFLIIFFTFIYFIKKRKYIAYGLIIIIFLISLRFIVIINEQLHAPTMNTGALFP